MPGITARKNVIFFWSSFFSVASIYIAQYIGQIIKIRKPINPKNVPITV
jgi:hypothetical protein